MNNTHPISATVQNNQGAEDSAGRDKAFIMPPIATENSAGAVKTDKAKRLWLRRCRRMLRILAVCSALIGFLTNDSLLATAAMALCIFSLIGSVFILYKQGIR